LPVLRGGIGNVAFFFVWVTSLAVSDKSGVDDFAGFNLIGNSMRAALRKLDPTYNNDIALNIGDSERITKRFLWTGVDWSPAIISRRLLWVICALAIATVASLFFHRFDPARGWSFRKAKKSPAVAGGNGSAATPVTTLENPPVVGHLTPLGGRTYETRFWQLLVSELRLMVKGQRWWWYVVALGLLVASAVSPTVVARQGVLTAAWIWPVLVWSQMGAREPRYATQSLIYSSARALNRQLPAVWAAGVIIAMLAGGGYALRLLMTGDWHGLFAWFASTLFIPSLALALGVLSGTSKPFEAIYTMWWYLGPLNHAPGLDFVANTPGASTAVYYFAFAASLVALAYFGRRARMAYA
jgi:hypothetical protein